MQCTIQHRLTEVVAVVVVVAAAVAVVVVVVVEHNAIDFAGSIGN